MSPNVFTVPLEATNGLIGYIWKLVLKLHQSHATSVGHVVIFDPGIFHQERRGYSSRENGGHCQEGKPGKQPHPWNPMPTEKGKNIVITSISLFSENFFGGFHTNKSFMNLFDDSRQLRKIAGFFFSFFKVKIGSY